MKFDDFLGECIRPEISEITDFRHLVLYGPGDMYPQLLHVVRRIQSMANQHCIRFVSVQGAVGFIGQVVRTSACATLQRKGCFKKHRL